MATFARVRLSPDVWHARLGHAGGEVPRRLSHTATGVEDNIGPLSVCEPCILGKHRHQPHPSTLTRATTVLALVHSDIASPFPALTPHGKKYMIIFLNDCENHLRTDLLATKDQALASFKTTHCIWEAKFGTKLLALQIDGAGKFLSDEFMEYLNDNGILRRVSTPYAHQQNGKVEQAIQTMEGQILAMMAAMGTAPSLWGEAALTASYLWQFTPLHTLPQGITPAELDIGLKPDISHLCFWGVRCFAQVPLELQTKLGLRSRECTFMGYPDGVKGYRVRDSNTGRFFNSPEDNGPPALELVEETADTPSSQSAETPSQPVTPPHPVSVQLAPPLHARSTRIHMQTEGGELLKEVIEKSKITWEKLATTSALQPAPVDEQEGSSITRDKLAATREKLAAAHSTLPSSSQPLSASPPHVLNDNSSSALPSSLTLIGYTSSYLQ
jgi:hypothetical protein